MHKLSPKIDGTVPGSFCYITIKERWPKILTKIIDQIHAYHSHAIKTFANEGDADVKYILKNLSELKYRVVTDKLLLDFEDKTYDADVWNKDLGNFRTSLGDSNVTWYKAPWLFVECYLYRKIYEIFITSKHMKEYDLFFEEKKLAFKNSKFQMLAISAELVKDTGNENLSNKQVRSTLLRLLQISLWSNKCDLSLSGGDPSSMSSKIFEKLEDLSGFLLINDLEEVCDKYLMGPSKLSRIDIILDNAGLEVFADICLADFLISKNLVEKVFFHGKAIPWFVSDTISKDFFWILQQLSESEDKNLKMLGLKWTKLVFMGKFVFQAHRFWTYGYAYCEMKANCSDLYKELESSPLLIFKGDLNYRKLVGDRYWPLNIEFKTALCGFEPTSILALRTLKAETIVGLTDSTIKKIQKKYPQKNDKSWMCSGEYAVAQMFKH